MNDARGHVGDNRPKRRRCEAFNAARHRESYSPRAKYGARIERPSDKPVGRPFHNAVCEQPLSKGLRLLKCVLSDHMKGEISLRYLILFQYRRGYVADRRL